MKTILVLGAGLSASTLIRYLLNNSVKHDWTVRIVDQDLNTVKKKINGHVNGVALSFNALNPDERRPEIQKADLVISMLPARFHTEVALDCIDFKTNLITPSYISPEMKALDQKASDGINIVYASFDSKNLNDYDIDANNLSKLFQKYDQGYLNLPWSGQLFKSIFNSASTLRITSNGISLEGYNTTVGKLTGQISYPFDIYPIKWTNSNIPFVLNFRDDENYSVKTYPPIYNFHTGKFNDQLNDVNLKLVQFSDTNQSFNFSPSNGQ